MQPGIFMVRGKKFMNTLGPFWMERFSSVGSYKCPFPSHSKIMKAIVCTDEIVTKRTGARTFCYTKQVNENI